MTYFPDLSSYVYSDTEFNKVTVNVGWLDVSHSYPRGAAQPHFLDRLWRLCSSPVLLSRGVHVCNLCDHVSDLPLVAKRGEETLVLGTAEIRAFGMNGTVYAAPDLVYHYVTAHNYLPPEEFIDAVVNGPVAQSQEYEAMLQQIGLHAVPPLREVVIWPQRRSTEQ